MQARTHSNYCNSGVKPFIEMIWKSLHFFMLADEANHFRQAVQNIFQPITTHWWQKRPSVQEVWYPYFPLTTPVMKVLKNKGHYYKVRKQNKRSDENLQSDPITVGTQRIFLSWLYENEFIRVQVLLQPSLDWRQSRTLSTFWHVTFSLSFYFNWSSKVPLCTMSRTVAANNSDMSRITNHTWRPFGDITCLQRVGITKDNR